MKVQRIKYERTGGFAGMRVATDFKPADLPDDQIRPLLDLLDDMDFTDMPENMVDDAKSDQFTYKITVETKKTEHTVITGDASAPEKMRELFKLLDRIARKKH